MKNVLLGMILSFSAIASASPETDPAGISKANMVYAISGQLPNDSWKGTMTVTVVGYDANAKTYQLKEHMDVRFSSDGVQHTQDEFENQAETTFSQEAATPALINCEKEGGTIETLFLAIGDIKTCKKANAEGGGFTWWSNVGPFPSLAVKNRQMTQGYPTEVEVISFQFGK